MKYKQYTLTHNFAVIVLVFPQEPLRVVIGVNVDLGNGIVRGWFGDTLMDAGLQPCQEQFQTVSLLYLQGCKNVMI